MDGKNNWKMSFIGLAFGWCSTACQAIDFGSVEFASGNQTRVVRVGVQWNWGHQWFQSNNTHVGGYWDATLAYWRGNRYRDIPDSIQNIADIGITPVVRFERNDKIGPYTEAGIGVHMLSAHYDNNGHQLSTNLQFATHLGVGYVWQNKLDIGVKIEHFSNGGIKEPNSGVNFIVLRVAYPF